MNNKIDRIETWLYEKDQGEVLKMIPDIEDAEELYLYSYNYNWDNGFEIPRAIMGNESCVLATALLLFYRADGEMYLYNKERNDRLVAWSDFIEELYRNIVSGNYDRGHIAFSIPLDKVSLYKLKKVLNEDESVFVNSIDGIDLDVNI